MIKVTTFNIHHGRGMDGRLDLSRIADVLEQSRADIIGLNEVDRHFSKRSGFTDQAAWLAERLRMQYAFGAALIKKSQDGKDLGQYGNALLSRYPIESSENHFINAGTRLAESRSLLECIVQVRDQPIKIYVTHLSIGPFLRKKQAGFIVNKCTSDRLPLILMGDLNMRFGGKRWMDINEYLSDACYSAGATPCYTFPSVRPKFQLDYIFASRDIRVGSVEALTGNRVASDHLPLYATFFLE